MAKIPVEIGPVGKRLAARLKEIRRQRQLTQQDLADLLDALGHNMKASAVSKIEAKDRRADVDDLVALALALGTSPNRLLFPENASDEQVELTPSIEVSSNHAWSWAAGETEVILDSDSDRETRRDEPRRPREPNPSFIDENRPHRPKVQPSYLMMLRNFEEVKSIMQAVKSLADKENLSLSEVLETFVVVGLFDNDSEDAD